MCSSIFRYSSALAFCALLVSNEPCLSAPPWQVSDGVLNVCEVLAHAELYHLRNVRIRGIVSWGFEGFDLNASVEDSCSRQPAANAIDIGGEPGIVANVQDLARVKEAARRTRSDEDLWATFEGQFVVSESLVGASMESRQRAHDSNIRAARLSEWKVSDIQIVRPAAISVCDAIRHLRRYPNRPVRVRGRMEVFEAGAILVSEAPCSGRVRAELSCVVIPRVLFSRTDYATLLKGLSSTDVLVATAIGRISELKGPDRDAFNLVTKCKGRSAQLDAALLSHPEWRRVVR